MFHRSLARVVLLVLIALCWGARPARAAPPQQYEGGIASPGPNSVLKGGVAVSGSANHPEFWKYEVWLAPGTFPSLPDSRWTRLAVREQSVAGGPLASFDSSAFPDGAYTLRLRVVRADGNWQDFDVAPLTIANAAPEPTATPEPAPTNTPPPAPTERPEPTSPPAATAATGSTPPAADVDPAAGPATMVPSLEDAAATATPAPIVTQPPSIVVLEPSATVVGVAQTGSGGDAPTPVSGGDAPRVLPENGASLWDVTSFAGACFSGLAISAGLFLLAGMLYLVRSLVVLLRS